ncbi:hypothetical protein POTOM_035362 [Populus tomentosa]|uniref:Uncharacterized protein n=1 Tax=Populus tomentosa TaxID=118781 RepID=A0A8X8CLY4_POPTO|nr:hypothetical protein POTOM_035362 [Populus tomentosa]
MLQINILVVVVLILGLVRANLHTVEGKPRRILLDTDVDTDDFFALLYLLKLNRSEFELEFLIFLNENDEPLDGPIFPFVLVFTINTNAWTDAGHAVSQIYDMLYMMGRDDVSVGMGGEGGTTEDSRLGERLDIDANYGIPASVNENFFKAFEQNQHTYEAQYCFQSLKMARDTWFDDQFYTSYFMWDSFMSGVAVSTMRTSHNQNGENEFGEMEYMNITVVTSNEPYEINDCSNPLFDDRQVPKFNLKKASFVLKLSDKLKSFGFHETKADTSHFSLQSSHFTENQAPSLTAILICICSASALGAHCSEQRGLVVDDRNTQLTRRNMDCSLHRNTNDIVIDLQFAP